MDKRDKITIAILLFIFLIIFAIIYFFRSNEEEIIKETENYKFILDIPEIAVVKADKKRINQVLYNLINNAINYTGEDLTVKINVLELKNRYKVEIIDSGKGIRNI